jgi:hypothetical protein
MMLFYHEVNLSIVKLNLKIFCEFLLSFDWLCGYLYRLVTGIKG